MRGVILAISADGMYGQISAEDGQRYSYWTSEVRNGPARVGQPVDFQFESNQAVDIFVVPQAAVAGRRPAPPSVIHNVETQFPPFDYWLNLFTSPTGRISRRQFWLHGFLPIMLAQLLLSWIPLVNIVVMLGAFWGSICISFKRFHDRGYSGFWSLLNLVPIFLGMALSIAAIFDGGRSLTLAMMFWGVGGIISIAQLIFVYVRAGEPGENRFGPDPLAAGPQY